MSRAKAENIDDTSNETSKTCDDKNIKSSEENDPSESEKNDKENHKEG